jgi:predicted RNA-binding protein with PIN domain
MAHRVFIDALNVVRGNVSLAKLEERRGLGAAQRELLRLVRDHVRHREDRTEWIVVFDGTADEYAEFASDEAILVLFSEDRSADEIIVERANDALALGHQTWIVSNDAEVRADGALATRAEDFYADLVRVAPSREPANAARIYEEMTRHASAEDVGPATDAGRRLIARLVERGHLPASAATDARLADDLARELARLSVRGIPAQKATKRLETFLRQRAAVHPESDPQKIFYRALKEMLSGVTR